MYNDHTSYLVNGWWDFCEIKITHHRNFQNFDLYSIYLTCDFTLKSIGRAHLIKISLKDITFSNKSRDKKLHTPALY